MWVGVELEKEEQKKAEITVPDEEHVASYYDLRQQLDQMNGDFREVTTHPNYVLPFLQPGRLVKVKYQQLDFGWGVIVNYQKRLPPKVFQLPETTTAVLLTILFAGTSRTEAGRHPGTRAVCDRCPALLHKGVDSVQGSQHHDSNTWGRPSMP